MGAMVFEIAGGRLDTPPPPIPLLKGVGTKMLLKGKVTIITNLKINLDDEKDKSDVKSEREETIQNKPNIQSIEEHKQDVKVIRTKPNIKKEEIMENKPDTHEEEKTALILGMTSIFTVWWLFK